MFKAGIVEPAKVTRSALQNAASIAALFLTTEAIVADKPEKAALPPAPPTWAGWTSNNGLRNLGVGVVGVFTLLLCLRSRPAADGVERGCDDPGPQFILLLS